MTGRVLVAGVGNIFLGDDGFGVAVAQALEREPLPDGVRAADFGIRGIHLAYELLDGGYEMLILADALSRGEAPGTVFVVERSSDDASGVAPDAHSMDPRTVFAYLESLGGRVPRTLIVGCEPLSTEEEIGLSEPVRSAVPRAVELIRRLVAEVGKSEAGAHRDPVLNR
jgi:hydrogenase maturation protease